MLSKYTVRTRFRVIIMVLMLTTMVMTAFLLVFMFSGISQSISEEYARLYTSEMVESLKAHIDPEIALSLKAARSEAINLWIKDESNQVLKQRALVELVEYAKILEDKNLFIAVNGTNNFYYIDETTTLATFVPTGTLKRSLEEDIWFFNTLSSPKPYLLNIDHDRFLDKMKIWINVKVEHKGEVLGVIGTGMSLSSFLEDIFLHHEKTGIKAIIINQYGDVQLDSELGRIRQNSFEPSQEVIQTIYSYIGSSDFNQQVDAYLSNPTKSQVLELKHIKYEYAALSPILGTEWHVATFFSTQSLYESIQFLPVFLMMFVIILLLGVIVNYIAKKIFVDPFEKLNASIELKEATRSHPLFGLDRKDEFGMLAQTVEKMSDRLMRAIPVGIFILDDANRFVYANPYFLEQMGYSTFEAFKNQYENSFETLFASGVEGTRISALLDKKLDQYAFEVELISSGKNVFWADIRMTRIETEKSGWQYEGILINIQGKKEHENKLVTIANTDQLTGIYNRHYFDELVEDAVRQSDRYGNALSLIIFDLDHFKRVNDTWGHAIGDQVLVRVAAEAMDCLRQSDSLVRWGGEEFAVLMPGTPLAGVFQAAEKIRLRLEMIDHPIAGKITASFGVAERQSYEAYKDWFGRVDQAMFKAKDSGRNIVIAADSMEKSQPSVVQLVWQEAFNSGNEVIDEQHKKLFTLCNALMNLGTEAHNYDLQISVFRSIVQHVSEHLIDEENILLEYGYEADAYLSHLKLHQKLKRTMLELQEKLRTKNLTATDVFLTLTNEVVVGHLLTEDVKFFPCLKEGIKSK